MDIQIESPQIDAEVENKQNASKKREQHRSDVEDGGANIKRLKLDKPPEAPKANVKDAEAKPTTIEDTQSKPNVPQSPKKRLELATTTTTGQNTTKTAKKEKFIYGNYNQYYGYRNKDFHDIRLDVFDTQRQLFRDQAILDIGCNSGFITLEVAKRYAPHTIVGIDIDRGLINQANKLLLKQKKALRSEAAATESGHVESTTASKSFPFNVRFVHGNYVLQDDVLLELEEREQFDVILCLSITKWIHLNFGDAGMKQAFRRMFAQLRSGGRLVLEAQHDNYSRRKKMTETIFANYKAMQFFPKHFTDYLLSAEVGFKRVELMGVPEHCAAGFKRPIQIFSKD